LHFFSGPDGVIPKSVDPNPLMTSLPKKFKHKSARIFLIEARSLYAFLEGLNNEQPSSSIGWKIMTSDSIFAVL